MAESIHPQNPSASPGAPGPAGTAPTEGFQALDTVRLPEDSGAFPEEGGMRLEGDAFFSEGPSMSFDDAGGAADPSAAPSVPDGPEGAPSPLRPGRRRRLRLWHGVALCLFALMVGAVVLAGLFVWDRWYRYDDVADLQGTWYVAGTDVPIQITADELRFTDETSYRYSVDISSKSLRFKLGNLDGQGHYWFADDRQVLIIVDGEDYSRWGTAADDLLRQLSALADVSAGKGVHLPKGDDVIVLSRTPDYVEPGAPAPGASDAAAGESAAPEAEAGPDGGAEGSRSQKDVFAIVNDLS